MSGLLTLLRTVNFRRLWQRRLRSILTVTGVAAGVALFMSISVINTTLLESTRATIRNLAGAAEIEVAAPDQTGLPEEVVGKIAAVEGVQQAIPTLRRTTLLKGREGSKRTMVLGVTPLHVALFPEGAGELGRFELQGGFGSDGGGLALSPGVAQSLGVDIGDQIRVETPESVATVTVGGIVSGHAVEHINGGELATMLLPAAQDLFDKAGRIDSVYVITDPDAGVADVSSAIDSALDGSAIVGAPGERGRGFERAFESIAALTSLSGLVALFVALFVVYNTMSMSLAERRREISMSLAFGATRAQVFGSFLAEAIALGAVASAAGVVSGIALATLLVDRAAEQYQIFPGGATGATIVQPLDVAFAAASGLIVALLGTYLPARRVANAAPIEALRPEAQLEWARLHGRQLKPAIGLSVAVIAVALGATGLAIYGRTGSFGLATVSMGLCLGGITLALPLLVPAGVRLLRPLFSRSFGTVGRLASDGLAKNPGRTSVTVGALVLSLGLVIGVGSAVGSFDAELRNFADGWYSSPLFVTTNSNTGGVSSDQPLDASFESKIEAVDGVQDTEPFRYASLTLEGEQVVTYVDPTTPETRSFMASGLAVGGTDPAPLVEALMDGEVVISRAMAERRDIEVGDTVRIPTPDGSTAFTVGGLFIDIAPFDSMHMGYDTYVEHWKDPHADLFGVVPEPGTTLSELSGRLEALVREENIPARVLTRDEMIGQTSESVKGLFSLAQGIQLAALIVAFFTVANTMFTAILERRWEFGLQQAIGMGRGQLGRSVILEAAGIGMLGAAGAQLVGLGLGFTMLSSMNELFDFGVPYIVPWPLFALSCGFGVVIAVLSGLYPRLMATRAPIIESLRYE